MSVFERTTLVDSPLADLHAIASELSIDGFRRLRRPELISAILEKQGVVDDGPSAEEQEEEEAPRSRPRSRSRRGSGRGRGAAEASEPTASTDGPSASTDEPSTPTDEPSAPADEPVETTPASATDDEDDAEETPKPRRSRSRSKAKDEEEDEPKPVRARRSRAKAKHKDETEVAEPAVEAPEAQAADDEPIVEGTVELLPNGSGFVRVEGPEPSDDDVYISAAQVKRCELVTGDTITGPKRAPRRSERFASLIRIETINGRPASELADSVRFDDLPAALPVERIKIGSDDPTLKAIEWLTPFGRGSRVTIVGASRAGKTEALKRLAEVLAGVEELTVTVALAGVRPEEISSWTAGPVAPAASASFAASEDAQAGAVEPVIDQAKRLAARGAHAVVLIDTLDGLHPLVARRVIAAARNIVDGGSVTVIATASAPVGGETTVIALDVALTSVGRFPALDLLASGALHPELLVGEAGAEAIARTRADISDDDVDE
jgi:transcription termination factor Rho